jgi:hypothetical protein
MRDEIMNYEFNSVNIIVLGDTRDENFPHAEDIDNTYRMQGQVILRIVDAKGLDDRD